jgi:uncharacterized protein YyaL (SSP411 family)
MVIIQIADDDSREYFSSRHAVIENLPAKAAEPTAYLCEDFSCRLPVTKPEALRGFSPVCNTSAGQQIRPRMVEKS